MKIAITLQEYGNVVRQINAELLFHTWEHVITKHLNVRPIKAETPFHQFIGLTVDDSLYFFKFKSIDIPLFATIPDGWEIDASKASVIITSEVLTKDGRTIPMLEFGDHGELTVRINLDESAIEEASGVIAQEIEKLLLQEMCAVN